MKNLLLALVFLACAISAEAQYGPNGKPRYVATRPAEPCVGRDFVQAIDTGINSICNGMSLTWNNLNTATGGGTVTVVASGSLTSGAFVTGGGSQTLQTPSPGSGLDGSGNATYVGTVTAPSFVGSGTGAGYLELHQGAAPAPGTTAIQIVAPVSVTSYRRTLAGAAASGIPHFANSANVVTETISAIVSADLNITTTTCTNQFVTAISAGGAGTCNSVTLAGAQFANQGTTVTVLHGNASGNPSFALVALGTDVSGTLAAAQFPALTGDITTSAGALATSLKSTGTAGTYRSTTFDAQGRETSGTNPTTFSGYALSDNSAGLRSTLTDENGSGVALFDSSTSATFITPLLGVPTSVTLTNGTGLPISTGVSGLGSGVATFLATPSGANLASALTTALPVSKGGTNCTAATITCLNNITGFSAAGTTGTTSTNLVFSTSPTFITPTLGAATATSINGNTFTTGTYTVTGTAAKTLNFTNTLTLSGTDSTTMTFPSTSATVARTDAANTFTGHQTIEGITSTGATGTGKLVFDTSPTFTTAVSAPVGSITSAGYQFAGIGSGAGISLAGGGGLYVIDGGGSSIASISGDIYFRGANSIGFSSSGNAGSTGGDTMFNRVSAGVFGVHTAVGAGFGGGMKMTSLTLPSLASDAATTDSTMCVTATTGVVTKGSGTLGICLGTSSLRFKKNVAPMNSSLAAVMLLKPITYRYRHGYGDSGAREQVGFGAEDVVKVMPELVGLGTDKKPLSVDILGMVPKLVKAMQEQQAQILSLQKQVAQQQTLIKRTRTRRN